MLTYATGAELGPHGLDRIQVDDTITLFAFLRAVRASNLGLDGQYLALGVFDRGQTFAEMTLFADLPRTFDVHASASYHHRPHRPNEVWAYASSSATSIPARARSFRALLVWTMPGRTW